MATQDLSAQAAKGNSPMAESPAIVSYTTKDGCHVDLDNLKGNLESIADDLNTAAVLAHEAGDPALAVALDSLWCDVDGLLPATPGTVGVKS